MTMKELEKKFTTAQSTTFGIINRLEMKGFVHTYLTENRTKIVEITKEGLDLVGFILPCFEESEKLLFESFSEEEYKTFIELLAKVELSASKF